MGLNSCHLFVKKNDGTLWCVGQNNLGQLGLGNITQKSTFTQTTIDNVESVYCGNANTFILKNDETLWSTGRNDYGQLGLGDTTQRNVFTQVDIDNVKSVYSEGNLFTFVVKKDGTLWAIGYNSDGQLGLGDTSNRLLFTKVDIDNVESISCGSNYSLVLKKDGTVWATGYNTTGQLGLGDTTGRKLFTKVDIDNVKSISCGSYYTFILKNDGTLWCTGYNDLGQLGLGDKINRNVFTQVDITDIKNISCGYNHTCVLKNDGTLWGVGYNRYGQLGLGDSTNRTTFTKIDISDIKSVYCGAYHTYLLKNDGTLWTTGYNYYGQLGLGDTTNRNLFTQVDINNIGDLSDENEDIIIQTLLYLIKTFQSKYTINKDTKTLTEITDTLTAELIQSKGIDLDIINENIDILPDEFSLVSDKEFGLTIEGLKGNEQMIVASNDFQTTLQENIDYFKSEATATGVSTIKVVFSIDGGVTWKTYKDGMITDANIVIPCKEFSTLTEQELEKWNNAKSEILLNGIDATALETIDFNTIEFNKIRFAYAMSVDTVDDVASLSKLIWQFDSKGSMQKLKDTEYDLEIHSNGIEITPLINSDMIKVNILSGGIGVSEDIEFATDLDIENMFM